MIKREWILGTSFLTAALFLLFGKAWMANLSNPLVFGFLMLWLFGVILASAFAVVRHAESLAVILGEPVGTVILTLAVIGIEVMMISAVMLTGESKPAVARDTMFAVVMIVLNGMVGISLLVGGLRHHEQEYNIQGANSFLSLIIPLAVLCLVLPNYTNSTAGPTLSTFQGIFLSVICLGLYAIFLVVQNLRHRDFFIAPADLSDAQGKKAHGHDHGDLETISTPYHAVFLVLYLLPLVILAKQIALPIDYGIREMGAPAALGGFLVAILILSPEFMSAIRGAYNNDLQRSINISLGSVLATIGLTVPAVLAIGLFTGKVIELGLDVVNVVLLLLTLGVSTLTFSNNRTNILLGAVHLLLFFAYFMLIFDRPR